MLGYKNQDSSRSAWKSNADTAISEKVSCFVVCGLFTYKNSVKICFLDFAFEYDIL